MLLVSSGYVSDLGFCELGNSHKKPSILKSICNLCLYVIILARDVTIRIKKYSNRAALLNPLILKICYGKPNLGED